MIGKPVMKRILTPQLILLAFFVLTLAVAAAAQQPRPANNVQNDPEPAQRGEQQRPNLLAELGLTQEQMDAIRRINQERKPTEIAARQRFQEANRALNMSIYGENVDEAAFQQRLREFQTTQAELARIKFTNELAVRRVLTQEQLMKFRDLRRRFAEGRDGRRPEGPPFRRLRRGMRPRGN